VDLETAPENESVRDTTLDGIFRTNVRRHPDALALVDPPDRATFTPDEPRRLSFAALDRAIGALGQQLQALGVPRGSPVALQLPNIVEGVVALLGIIRAGYVAVPLPLLWRQADAARALNEIGAAALIVTRDEAEHARRIAADTASLRYVCAFGEAPADGIVALGDVFSGNAVEVAPLPPHDIASPVLITFNTGLDGPDPFVRTQSELLVGGMATVLAARMRPRTVLLGTMLPSSFAVLATTLVPWLLTGGTLLLHQPFDAATCAAQIEQGGCDVAVLPGPCVPLLADAGLIGGERPAVLALWRSPERQVGSAVWTGAAPLVDVLVFGEDAIVPLRRAADGRPAVMHAGPLLASDGTTETMVLEAARNARGTLELGGPMLPRHNRIDQSALPRSSDTGYPCRIDALTGTIVITGTPPGLVHVGGYRFAMHELEDLVGRADGDAVLAALPDLLAGVRLAATAADTAAIRRALADLGANPLIGAAFRGRAPAA
jgi:hypothetical protein